ncbi:MAG: hypothetical protein CM15mP26_2030 [Actinomycetota bacterium]|nr:MAG: hypothetical protein CM15mP26_2030 [Actinomycetota bacterium]
MLKNRKNFDEALNPHPFKGPYRDNMTDYIWEVPDANTDEKIGEIVEHLLHTITNVALVTHIRNGTGCKILIYIMQQWKQSTTMYSTFQIINRY